jgi:repressor LexA
MKGVLLMVRAESIRATFKDNLNKLLTEKDVTQKSLADFVGVSTATVSDWKKGKKLPRMDKVDKICQFFHIDRRDIVEFYNNDMIKKGYDNPHIQTKSYHNISQECIVNALNREKDILNHAHYKIPILGTVAAGEPLEAVENIIGYEYLDDRYDGDGYQYFALKIRGDSMTPTIMDGDVVIVRKQSTVDSGQLAIVLVDGENATAKQIDISPSGITVIGHNASVFAPRFVPNAEVNARLQILGRVMEVRRRF